MPHIVLKMIEGRSDAKKQEIADALVKILGEIADIPAKSLSVAIEDVAQANWMDAVFEPEIRGNKDNLFKLPGYRDV